MIRFSQFRRFLRLLVIVATFAAFPATFAGADYLMTTGDIVEVSVYGLPDLRRRATLGVDGEIVLPLVGSIKFAGLSVSQARNKLRELLVQNTLVANPDVTVAIVEHRPFYISGDVAKPGSYPYQPGMTVRHAIAVAGGFDVLRMRLNAMPLMEAADLSNEFESLRMDLVKQLARVKRLHAELEGKDEIDFGGLARVPIPSSLYADISGLEIRHLEARASSVAKEKASFDRTRNHVIAQLTALERQQKVEEEGLQQQSEDAAKVKANFDRGLAPLSRVLEEQRSILMSKSRLSSTTAQVMNAKRTVEELGRQLDKTDEVLRLDALKELQEGTLTVEKIRLRMQMVAEKLAYVAVASNATSLKRGVVCLIYRKVGQQQTQIVAEEGTELVSGDVLEIALPRPATPGLPPEPHPN